MYATLAAELYPIIEWILRCMNACWHASGNLHHFITVWKWPTDRMNVIRPPWDRRIIFFWLHVVYGGRREKGMPSLWTPSDPICRWFDFSEVRHGYAIVLGLGEKQADEKTKQDAGRMSESELHIRLLQLFLSSTCAVWSERISIFE